MLVRGRYAGLGVTNENKVIELTRSGKTVSLKINYFDRPFELDQPVKFTFGLQATPLRPLPANWRLLRFNDHANAHYPNVYYGQNVAIIGWGANGRPPPPEKRKEAAIDPLNKLSSWKDWPITTNPVKIRQVFEEVSCSLKLMATIWG